MTSSTTVDETSSTKDEVKTPVEIEGRIETKIDYNDDLADITSDKFKTNAAQVEDDLEKVFPTFQGINVTGFELATDTESQSQSLSGLRRRKRQSGAAIAIFEAESESHFDEEEILEVAKSKADNLTSLSIEGITNSIGTLEITSRNTTLKTTTEATTSTVTSPTTSSTTTSTTTTTTAKQVVKTSTTTITMNTVTNTTTTEKSKSSFAILEPSVLNFLIIYFSVC